jgi:hypothetical protein
MDTSAGASCASLEEALEIAAKHPAASDGIIEVRPLWED